MRQPASLHSVVEHLAMRGSIFAYIKTDYNVLPWYFELSTPAYHSHYWLGLRAIYEVYGDIFAFPIINPNINYTWLRAIQKDLIFFSLYHRNIYSEMATYIALKTRVKAKSMMRFWHGYPARGQRTRSNAKNARFCRTFVFSLASILIRVRRISERIDDSKKKKHLLNLKKKMKAAKPRQKTIKKDVWR